MCEQFCLVLCKHLGAEAVAGGPVVDIGQEFFGLGQRCAVIPDGFDQEGMEIVFFIVVVRQCLQERFRLRGTCQLLCQLAQGRCPHTDDFFFRHGGHQRALKVPVCLILQAEQLRPDGLNFCLHHVPLLLHLALLYQTPPQKQSGFARFFRRFAARQNSGWTFVPEHAIIPLVNAGIVHRLVYQPSKLRRWVRFPLPAPCRKKP